MCSSQFIEHRLKELQAQREKSKNKDKNKEEVSDKVDDNNKE